MHCCLLTCTRTALSASACSNTLGSRFLRLRGLCPSVLSNADKSTRKRARQNTTQAAIPNRNKRSGTCRSQSRCPLQASEKLLTSSLHPCRSAETDPTVSPPLLNHKLGTCTSRCHSGTSTSTSSSASTSTNTSTSTVVLSAHCHYYYSYYHHSRRRHPPSSSPPLPSTSSSSSSLLTSRFLGARRKSEMHDAVTPSRPIRLCAYIRDVVQVV